MTDETKYVLNLFWQMALGMALAIALIVGAMWLADWIAG
jgi:hypothetical protein